MNENYIMLNGKRVDLTDEQIEKLGLKVEKVEMKDPFTKVNDGCHYYAINVKGELSNIQQINNDELSDEAYKVANYCTDRSLLQQRAYHETLSRLLWRFSMQNDGDKIDWDNEFQRKYFIYYDIKYDKTFNIGEICYSHSQDIFFHTKEIAQRAIDEIVLPFMKEHPDFVW